METLLSEKEAAAFLGIGEEKLTELVENKLIPAYLIGDRFLRFKKEELQILKDMLKENKEYFGKERVFLKAYSRVQGVDRFKEIIRANDIYLILGVIVLLILVLVFFR